MVASLLHFLSIPCMGKDMYDRDKGSWRDGHKFLLLEVKVYECWKINWILISFLKEAQAQTHACMLAFNCVPLYREQPNPREHLRGSVTLDSILPHPPANAICFIPRIHCNIPFSQRKYPYECFTAHVSSWSRLSRALSWLTFFSINSTT